MIILEFFANLRIWPTSLQNFLRDISVPSGESINPLPLQPIGVSFVFQAFFIVFSESPNSELYHQGLLSDQLPLSPHQS